MLIETSSNTHVDYYFRKVDGKEIRANKYNKTNGWDFSWATLLKDEFQIFALVTDKYPEAQGLIALKHYRYASGDGYIEVANISSSPHNKMRINGAVTWNQRYSGVGKCLVAFACQYSIEIGLEGFVSLTSKKTTRNLYLNLGADNPFGELMTFDDQVAKALSMAYFKGGIKWR